MNKASKTNIWLWLSFLWLAFCVSLAGWWLVFGLRQIEVLKSLDHALAFDLVKKQRMLVMEGGVLIAMLVAGGGLLVYFSQQVRVRHQQVREFFATFTHELKTSLASLRLQAESLQEDLLSSGLPQAQQQLLKRLLKDSVRLELQLENSLFLAHAEARELILQPISLKKLVSSMEHHWPELKIELNEDATLLVDARAMESILKNIIQNAVVHGQAKKIILRPTTEQERICINILDDGTGFKGDPSQLGRLFKRHTTKSGSGVGLYLSQDLMKKMGGHLEFPTSSHGFLVMLRFEEKT